MKDFFPQFQKGKKVQKLLQTKYKLTLIAKIKDSNNSQIYAKTRTLLNITIMVIFMKLMISAEI